MLAQTVSGGRRLTLNVIADPWFYAVAVPAVLLMGLAKSGFASGFGALATPVLAIAVPVPQAAAIMLPLLLVMDAVGLQQLWPHRDRALLRLLLPAGLAGTVVGTLLFGVFSTRAVSAVVGGLTLLFLAQRLFFPPRADDRPASKALGRVLGVAAGFTSFVAHAGGPPVSAYLLPLRLKPLVFAATTAVFFAAVNLSKWIPYAWLGLIDLRNMSTSLVLLPLAIATNALGFWLVRVTPTEIFYRITYIIMFIISVELVREGLGELLRG